MERHIDVIPITGPEWMAKHRESISRAFARMTPQQVAEMDQLAISTCKEVLRDSPVPVLRADALEMLQGMGAMT